MTDLNFLDEVDLENWEVIGSGGQGEVRKGLYNGRSKNLVFLYPW